MRIAKENSGEFAVKSFRLARTYYLGKKKHDAQQQRPAYVPGFSHVTVRGVAPGIEIYIKPVHIFPDKIQSNKQQDNAKIQQHRRTVEVIICGVLNGVQAGLILGRKNNPLKFKKNSLAVLLISTDSVFLTKR